MHKQNGLTLAELLIALALLAIIAQVALPAWQTFIAKNRSQALQHSVERAVQLARARAVTQRTNVELCGSSDALNCSNSWSTGWLVRAIPHGQEPLPPEHVAQLNPHHQQLQWAGFRQKIIFHANGYSTASNGRFFVCRDGIIDWQLVLNRQGRLRRASPQENREQDHRCAT